MHVRIFLIVALLSASSVLHGQDTAQADDRQRVEETANWTAKLPKEGWSTQELIDAANTGDFTACMMLAKYWTALCEPGRKVSPEILEARFWSSHWLNKAAATGHPAPRLYQEALKLSEAAFDDPENAPEEFKKLCGECEKLAEQGDIVAIEALGLFLPAPPDETIEKWFAPLRRKADAGDTEAKATLGRALIFGNLTNESFLRDGLKYAREVAEQGNVNGMKVYGQALVLDLAGTNEFEEGMKWLNKAADAGHIEAMQALLLTMVNLDSMTQQEQQAFKAREAELTKRLCDRGQLNVLASEGMKLVESGEAPQAGLKLLERAGDLGSFSALDSLAKYYHDDGYYVPANIEKSIMYAQKLADMGGASGLLRLAGCYEKGHGIAKNESKAYNLVCQAQVQGLADAYVEQARMILKGIGTHRDPKKAFEILTELNEELSPPTGTHFLLGYMYESGLGTERNYQTAFEQYSKGHDAGDPKAINNLASMYEAGLSVQKDREQAMKLYAESAQLGNEDAAANLARLKSLGTN